eukprot:1157605-Pelagomonas_calceolata.AAC.7
MPNKRCWHKQPRSTMAPQLQPAFSNVCICVDVLGAWDFGSFHRSGIAFSHFLLGLRVSWQL